MNPCFGITAAAFIAAQVTAAPPRVLENEPAKPIYHSPQTPGYTAWTTLWRTAAGELRLAFQQVTGPVNPVSERINVTVILGSADEGATWKKLREVPARTNEGSQGDGIYAAPGSSSFCGHGLAVLKDGTLVTGLWAAPNDKSGYIQRSTDDGLTWSAPIYLRDPETYKTYPTQIRLLHDGRLVLVAGTVKQADAKTAKFLLKEFFESRDEGRTWSHIWTMPVEIGLCEESDFVELDNGDLLFSHRAEHYDGDKYVSSNRLQNIFHRKDDKWEIGPCTAVPMPHSGFPELLKIRDGSILHIGTDGIWQTDRDLHTWSRLDLRGSPYYPRATQLRDGRILVVGHVGSDDEYGKVDQTIVGQTFRLEEFPQTPAPIPGAEKRDELRVGIAGHAFDHLGAIGDQAQAAVASGMTIIYPACFGQIGYEGLPGPEEIEVLRNKFSAYLRDARVSGIKLALAYVCSTSIVRLETFDKNWSKEFRAQFATPPAQWLQQDRDGKPLPSWYGGNYLPACKNNPDWRTYEKFMVKLQLESGNDGIFFDNPTVHPKGCYCEHCLRKFAGFLGSEGTRIDLPATDRTQFLRQLATTRSNDFLRFRATIARDFLAEMRTYARTIKRDALITCNNSLNTPGALFSQCRTYGYNIYEMSKVEDLVVVEDMATQPRVLPDGSVAEYGPIYELLHAISHRRPVVACALADGDYHTAPNLVRLAMAEAAAHRASYLAWPTWPENVRQKMIAAIRPQADLLRKNASLLNETTSRVDALLFLPFRRWVDTADCQPLKIASALSRANVQFEAVCEDDLAARLNIKSCLVLLAESPAVLSPSETATIDAFKRDGGQVIWTNSEDWLAEFQRIAGSPSVTIQGPATIRAVVHDQPGKRIVHLLNLNVRRLSSFEDKITPATDVRLQVRVPFAARSVNALSADPEATQGPVHFTASQENNETVLNLTIPRLDLHTILVITP